MAEFRSWKLALDCGSDIRQNLDAPGFDAAQAQHLAPSSSSQKRKDPAVLRRKQEALLQKSKEPLMQVGFMCFMMWMMGNGIQIFSIMMTITGLSTPVMAIMRSGQIFKQDEDGKLDVMTPRLLYCLIYCGQLLFVMNKLNNMGLLPTHPSDWLSSMPVPRFTESAYGAA